MPETVAGLPVHVLVVHATVVTLPAAGLLVAATALLPRLRAWAGPLPLLLALASLVLVPVTTRSGEDLRRSIGTSPAIDDHAALGEMVIWWVLALVVVAAAGSAVRRGDRVPPRPLVAGLGVASVVVGVGLVVQVVLTGHSGAEAVWGGRVG